MTACRSRSGVPRLPLAFLLGVQGLGLRESLLRLSLLPLDLTHLRGCRVVLLPPHRLRCAVCRLLLSRLLRLSLLAPHQLVEICAQRIPRRLKCGYHVARESEGTGV